MVARSLLAAGNRLVKNVEGNTTWLKPGLVGRVKFLAGSTGLRHATVTSFWLEQDQK